MVTLPEWARLRDVIPPPDAAFTTVMSWSYFKGKLIYKGAEYAAKAPEYEKFHDLPRRVDVPLTLAVAGQHKDKDVITPRRLELRRRLAADADQRELSEVHRRFAGRMVRREELLRRDQQRLVQLPHRVLSRCGKTGRGAGYEVVAICPER